MRPDPALIREIAPTGRLRASLNMGNPVLAHSRTAAERPAGVTIDLARSFAALLGVEVQFLEFDTPGKSGAAVAGGEADIGFLAVDPKRAEGLHFTAPYVQIDGCYLVRADSRGRSAEAVRLLELFIGEQRQSGFVQQALDRHGIEGATVPA